MYWRLGGDTSSGTYDRAASIWFAALCVIFQSGNNACTIFYSQKPLLRREITNGLYHYSAFYIAKGLTSLPFQLAYSIMFNTAVYFLVRPHARPLHQITPDAPACWHTPSCSIRRSTSWCAAMRGHASSRSIAGQVMHACTLPTVRGVTYRGLGDTACCNHAGSHCHACPTMHLEAHPLE